MKTWLLKYPNLTCSLIVHSPYFVMCMSVFFLIICTKVLIALRPLAYLEMSHEYLFKVSVSIAACVWTLELVLILAMEQTICNRNILNEIEQIFNISIEESGFNYLLPVGPFHLVPLLVAEMVYLAVTFIKKRQQRSIHPQPSNNNNNAESSSVYFVNFKSDDVSTSPMPGLMRPKKSSAPSTSSAKNYRPIETSLASVSYITVAPVNHDENAEIILNIPALEAAAGTGQENSEDQSRAKRAKVKVKTNLTLLYSIFLCAMVTIIYLTKEASFSFIWVFYVAKKILCLVIPIIWILRSEDITQFTKRKLNKFGHQNV